MIRFFLHILNINNNDNCMYMMIYIYIYDILRAEVIMSL